MTAQHKTLGFIGEHCWEIFQWDIRNVPIGTIVYFSEGTKNWFEAVAGIDSNDKIIRVLSLEDVPKPYRIKAMLML